MWNIFRKIVKTGIVTRDLPLETEKIGFQGPPQINFAGCTACGRCIETCPADALKIEQVEGYPWLYLHVGRCVFCGRCSLVCPEGVIGVSRHFHWAGKEVAGLIVQGRCGKG